jgi:hypothetical protein
VKGIVCTLTNTRIGKSVRVEKNLSPGDDPGQFNLLVNGSTVATNAGNGDAGTLTGVAVGSKVTVSETQGTGTSLANYTSSLSCTGVTASLGPTSGTFTMPDADVSCTFTNTRKTSSVTIQKSLSPTDDPGRFDLLVNGVVVANDITNGGSGQATVAVGSNVAVSESGGTGTSLGNYTSSLSCTGVTASGSTSGNFTMPNNAVTCTFTNTRIPPTPIPPTPIPTVGALGLGALALMLAGIARRRMR